MAVIATEAELGVYDASRVGEWARFDPLARVPIRGEFLKALLLSSPIEGEGRGPLEMGRVQGKLRLSGAWITGLLDVEGGRDLPGISLENCDFDEAVNISDSVLGSLSLRRSRINGVSLRRASLAGDLDVSGTAPANGAHSPAWIDARGCRISGNIAAGGAKLSLGRRLRRENGSRLGLEYALCLTDADVSGSVNLADDFEADGGISLATARVGGDVIADGAILTAQGKNAFEAQAARIGGGLMLRRGCVTGSVCLSAARVGADLALDGSKIRGTHRDGDCVAISAYSVVVVGSIRLNDSFKAIGSVILDGCEIGAHLDCSAGEIRSGTIGPHSISLAMERATVRLDVRLNKRFWSKGWLSISGTKIGGHLHCWDACFHNRISSGIVYALDASDTVILGSVVLGDNFSARGMVSFFGAKIGSLYCEKVTIRNELRLDEDTTAKVYSVDLEKPGTDGGGEIVRANLPNDPISLDLRNAHVSNDVELIKSSFIGMVCLTGAKLQGYLFCRKVKLVNPYLPHASSSPFKALSATNISVGGDVIIQDSQVVGHLAFEHSNIEGDMTWDQLTFSNGVEIEDIGYKWRQFDGEKRCFTWSGRGIHLDTTEPPVIALQDVDATSHGRKRTARLTLARSKIGATLRAHRLTTHSPLLVDFGAAHAYTLDDKGLSSAWGYPHEGTGPASRVSLNLDGFTYQRIEHFPLLRDRSKVRVLRLLSSLISRIRAIVDLFKSAEGRLTGATGFGDRIAAGLDRWKREIDGEDIAGPRLLWLKMQDALKQGGFFPQPFQQLASVLRAQGHVVAARRIAIEAQHAAQAGAAGPLKRFFWGYLFGFGLSPGRATVTLFVVWFLGFAMVHQAWSGTWFWSAAEKNWTSTKPVLVLTSSRMSNYTGKPSASTPSLVEVQCGKSEINPAFYPVDMMLPIVPLHQVDRCEVAARSGLRWWQIAWAAFSIVGKVIASLALLTYSGVVRPKD